MPKPIDLLAVAVKVNVLRSESSPLMAISAALTARFWLPPAIACKLSVPTPLLLLSALIVKVPASGSRVLATALDKVTPLLAFNVNAPVGSSN